MKWLFLWNWRRTKWLFRQLPDVSWRSTDPSVSRLPKFELSSEIFQRTTPDKSSNSPQYHLILNEHMLDYITWTKDLRTAILDAELRDRKHLNPQFVTEIDNLTARSFYEGLPLAYCLQMSPKTRQRYSMHLPSRNQSLNNKNSRNKNTRLETDMIKIEIFAV